MRFLPEARWYLVEGTLIATPYTENERAVPHRQTTTPRTRTPRKAGLPTGLDPSVVPGFNAAVPCNLQSAISSVIGRGCVPIESLLHVTLEECHVFSSCVSSRISCVSDHPWLLLSYTKNSHEKSMGRGSKWFDKSPYTRYTIIR